jgi:protein SCO1/2
MTISRGMPVGLLWGFPIILLLALVAALVINWAEASRSRIEVLGELPAFQLTERGGERIDRGDLKGRLHVVCFIFTNCPGVCPLMMTNLKPLYDLYEHSDKIRFLSISVDPESDSLAALQAYAEKYGITDNRWLLACAPIEAVKGLMEDGFMLDSDDLPGGHPTHFILVDDQARIRGYYPYDEPGAIYLMKQHIRELARDLQEVRQE